MYDIDRATYRMCRKNALTWYEIWCFTASPAAYEGYVKLLRIAKTARDNIQRRSKHDPQ